MRFAAVIQLLLLASFNFSCQQIKNKAAKAADMVWPTFDEHTPDTWHNKERFNEFFGFYPTADVKNIYCYGDVLGFDGTFQFSFNCDSATVIKIIEKYQLTPPDTTATNSIWHRETQSNISSYSIVDYEWWNDSITGAVMPYCKCENDRMFTYLWYDTANKKAYYLNYDI